MTNGDNSSKTASNRRAFIRKAGVASTLALAGCLGGGDGGTDTQTEAEDTPTEEEDTPTEEEDTPTEEEDTPTEGGDTPTESTAMSGESPTEGTAMSGESPTEGGDTPSEGGSGTPGNESTGNESWADIGTTTAPDEWENGKSIHYIGPTIEAAWWRAMPIGNAIEAHKRGWDFSFSIPGFDPAAMNDEIRTQAQENDALIVNPASFEAHASAIDTAWNEYNTPVAGNKDGVGSTVTHNIQSSDLQMGEIMANAAISHIEEQYDNPSERTIVHFQGDPNVTGWRRRAESVRQRMSNSDINYVEQAAGGSVSSWSSAAQTYFANNTADAALSDSDGAYTQVILNALAANDMLYYQGHEDHVFLAGIDGYPSTAMFVRKGLQDITVPQTPFCITQNISKLLYEHILDDPSIQDESGEMPQVPTGTPVNKPTDPVEMYWAESEDVTLQESDYGVPITSVPQPPYVLNRENCNQYNHWANVFPAWMGRTDLMSASFDVGGERPSYVDNLVSEFNQNLDNGQYGERLDYIDI